MNLVHQVEHPAGTYGRGQTDFFAVIDIAISIYRATRRAEGISTCFPLERSPSLSGIVSRQPCGVKLGTLIPTTRLSIGDDGESQIEGAVTKGVIDGGFRI